MGNNKEVIDEETFAILSALRIFDQRQENDHKYTIFADSTAAIDRVGSDRTGPGQFLARVAIEACSRLASRGNEAMILWVPAHVGIAGSEEADRLVKEAAGGQF